MLKNSLAAVAAISLMASPALAVPSAPQPATEQVDGSELRAPGSPIGPILFALVLVFIVLLATETEPFDNKDRPTSP